MRHAVRLCLLCAGLAAGCGIPSGVEQAGGARVFETAGGALDPVPALDQALVPARLEGAPRIVFLGDSLTYGLGLERDDTVPSLIQDRLDGAGLRYVAVNRGVSGDTSAGGLRRLDLALTGDVRILVLELGANDGLRGLTFEQMRENLRTIIERCLERDVEVVLTGMEALTNLGAWYTSEFRQVFRDLAGEYDVTFVPFFLEGVAGDPQLNQGDQVHPNAAGARIVADHLWRVLEPMIE